MEKKKITLVNVVFNTFLCINSFVECKDCGRKMHQICALHYDIIWPTG